jgi:hypothetical protein
VVTEEVRLMKRVLRNLDHDGIREFMRITRDVSRLAYQGKIVASVKQVYDETAMHDEYEAELICPGNIGKSRTVFDIVIEKLRRTHPEVEVV